MHIGGDRTLNKTSILQRELQDPLMDELTEKKENHGRTGNTS